MKIKDLDLTKSLERVKVKTPNGVVGYWKSQWQAGVWLSNGKTSQIYPQFVNNLQEALEWDIADDEDEVNCDKLTSFELIDNSNKTEFQDEKT